MMHRAVCILTMIVVVLSTGIALAGHGHGRGGEFLNCDIPKENCDKHLGGAIDLTEEQQQQLDTLREAEFEKLEPLRKEMQALRDEMHQVLESSPIDEGKLRQLAREKADKKVDMKIARKEFHDKVAEILTPEQMAQLKERRKEHHGGYGHHGNHGKHGKEGHKPCYIPEK